MVLLKYCSDYKKKNRPYIADQIRLCKVRKVAPVKKLFID